MRKIKKITAAGLAIVGAVASIVGILSWFGISPVQAKPDLGASFDMKTHGRVTSNDIHTAYRPPDSYNDGFVFTISSVGSHAENLNIKLQYYPHSEWLNLNNVKTSVKIIDDDLTNITIPFIARETPVDVIYDITISPTEYDKVVQSGMLPYLYYNISAVNTNEKIDRKLDFYIP